MSQTSEDLELNAENNHWGTRTFLSNEPPKPSREASNFGDSSGPLFFIYSKAAEDEDNKMVERWQKDADGILIFTGLFSAALAALLAVAVQDLRPNSQDISAFYLGIIYQVLADPNASISSPIAKPPPFSAPRYTVWVNSLWFLSLVMSISCALLATSLQQWARRYLRLTRPSQCGPEKRARMRAFYANGVDDMYVPWAVEGLPTLLHLSVLFFFLGLVIFLFYNDHEVFSCVISWIGLFSVVYGLITLLPLIRHDSPYNSPLSRPAWFLYTAVSYLIFKGLIFMKSVRYPTWARYFHLRSRSPRNRYPHHFKLRDRYLRWMFSGMEKAAEETASKQSSEIDIRILDWTVSTLGDDDSLKNLFETIPGFFDSKMLKHLKKDIPSTVRVKFFDALHGFWERAWTSNSISDSEKASRLDVSLNAMSRIHDRGVWSILYDIAICHLMDMPLTVEMGHTVARWCTSDDEGTVHCARHIVAAILVLVQQGRDDSWLTLATRAFGPLEGDVLDSIADGGDSVLLAILIKVAHQSIPFGRIPFFLDSQRTLVMFGLLNAQNTLPRLQRDFCTLWNTIFLEARTLRPNHIHLQLLKSLRLPYIALHQGTDAALTAFSASTRPWDDIVNTLSSYPFCHLASHRAPLPTQPGSPPDASPRTVPQQDKRADIVEWLHKNQIPSNQATTSQAGEASQGPNTAPLANPVHSSPHPVDSSPTGDVTAATQHITSTATLTHPPEGNEQQQDKNGQRGEPDFSQIEPIVYMLEPTYGLAPASTPPPTLIITMPPDDTGAATTSGSSHPTPSVVGSAIPPCPHEWQFPHMQSPRPISLSTRSATLPLRPTSGLSLSHLRARGLVNSGNMCFAITVLQLLVHSPPSWNLFRILRELKEQRGASESPETGGCATPLVDATMRFFDEFTFKEEPPRTQQPPQHSPGGISREGGEETDNSVIDSFEPTYLYDVMKEKRRLKDLLDGQVQDAKEFLDLYLEALTEEMSQSDHTEGRRLGLTNNFDRSPITHIFGGKFRSTIRKPNQPDVVSIEDWRSLQLDIQPDSVNTIQDALACISRSQSVQRGPTDLGDSSHQVLIEALPPILVLHLKRFRYDAAAGGVIKIGKSIQFASELEIPLDIMAPTSQRPSEPPHYKLYAVLYHHGESAGGGHCTVDILHANGLRDGGSGESWLHFDNETVSVVHHRDVFGVQGIERRAPVERCAYLLFYCRTATET